ncbi:MAG: hypothetical protein Q4B54_13955 [Coriobacteriales bacterium]|nr:hypothetical protein [Coriobacteriales bacterium]
MVTGQARKRSTRRRLGSAEGDCKQSIIEERETMGQDKQEVEMSESTGAAHRSGDWKVAIARFVSHPGARLALRLAAYVVGFVVGYRVVAGGLSLANADDVYLVLTAYRPSVGTGLPVYVAVLCLMAFLRLRLGKRIGLASGLLDSLLPWAVLLWPALEGNDWLLATTEIALLAWGVLELIGLWKSKPVVTDKLDGLLYGGALRIACVCLLVTVAMSLGEIPVASASHAALSPSLSSADPEESYGYVVGVVERSIAIQTTPSKMRGYLQEVAEAEAANLGLQDRVPQVKLIAMGDPFLRGPYGGGDGETLVYSLQGMYDEEANEILINALLPYWNEKGGVDTVNKVVHEMAHAYQYAVESGEDPACNDTDLAGSAKKMAEEGYEYVHSSEDFDAYHDQEVEASARDYAHRRTVAYLSQWKEPAEVERLCGSE